MLSKDLQFAHSKLISRLVKPSGEILASLNETSGETMCAFLHATLGISGEVAELCQAVLFKDPENLLEEAGDILFYVGDLVDSVNWYCGGKFTPNGASIFDFSVIEKSVGEMKGDHYSGIVALVASAGVVTDLIKKHVIYGQDLNDEKLHNAVVAITYSTHLFLRDFGFTLDQAVQHNIDKLNRRYPEGYTDAAAKERTDKPAGE